MALLRRDLGVDHRGPAPASATRRKGGGCESLRVKGHEPARLGRLAVAGEAARAPDAAKLAAARGRRTGHGGQVASHQSLIEILETVDRIWMTKPGRLPIPLNRLLAIL